jgi:alpha-galactosidase
MLGLPRPPGMGVLEYLYRWLPAQGLDYAVGGLNHFIFLTKAERHGRDLLPMVRDFCRRHHHLPETRADPAAQQATSTFSSTWAAAFAVCRQAGHLPINADRHTVEFIPSLCNPLNGFGMAYHVLKTTVDARRLGKVYQLEEIRRIARGEETVNWTSSGEEMAEIIRAIFVGGSVRGVVNVPNQGQIANLPQDVIVETLGTISRDGIVPDRIGDLPGAVGSWCRLHADVQELTLRAALDGDRDLLIQALTLDPLTAGMDLAAIPNLAADLVNANRAWLPRFFK